MSDRRTLHPHQFKALAQLRQALLSGLRSPLLMGATGFGKSVISSVIARGYSTALTSCGAKQRAIFVVPAIELIEQTIEMFESEGITDIGVIQADHPRRNDNARVLIASVQTLMNRKRIPMAQCVIIDECHRWFDFYEKWMAMPEWRNCKFIGMSATPWTKGLGKHFDWLCIPTTVQELIDTINPVTGKSFLAPFKVFAPSHPDLTGVGMVGDDYNKGQLGKAMLKPKLVADAVSTWCLRGRGRATLCYAVNRAHALALWQQFRAAGVRAAYVDGKTSFVENEDRWVSRKDIKSMSKRGEIEVVVNIGVLTTGCDWPWISCISLCRPTKSEMLLAQIFGRGLRPFETKDYLLVLDHSDSTERLELLAETDDGRLVYALDARHTELDDGKHRVNGARKPQEEPTPKPCPSCHAMRPVKTAKCPSCGFVARVQNAVRAVDGTLVEITAERKTKKPEATTKQKQEFYSGLLGYCDEKAMNQGWAFYRYCERFGVKGLPNTVKKIALEPSPEVRDWIRRYFANRHIRQNYRDSN